MDELNLIKNYEFNQCSYTDFSEAKITTPFDCL